MSKENIDAKAAELREKLEDESLDKCKVKGGFAVGGETSGFDDDSSSGGK